MNEIFVNQFRLLIKQIKFDIDFSTGKEKMVNMYRLGAVQKVLKILENLKIPITSSDQLKSIKGVGKKSLERIDEILKTGKLSEIQITEDIDKYLNIISKLEDVINIGRKKAYELFKKYNITSVEELKEKHKLGKIDLPDNIIKGLEYYNKIKEKIPREEITELKSVLLDTLLKIDPHLFGIVCGSYRRLTPTSNDIDFVIVHTNIKTSKDVKDCRINYIQKFVTLLKDKGIIIDSLTSDTVLTKYMGICKIKTELRRIDIRFIPYESYYPAILYFTGSKDFNKKMRMIAITMGYTLNEYGLFDKNGKNYSVYKSEKDIFDILGMVCLPPDKRT